MIVIVIQFFSESSNVRQRHWDGDLCWAKVTSAHNLLTKNPGLEFSPQMAKADLTIPKIINVLIYREKKQLTHNLKNQHFYKDISNQYTARINSNVKVTKYLQNHIKSLITAKTV